jgi:hypothetical protein
MPAINHYFTPKADEFVRNLIWRVNFAPSTVLDTEVLRKIIEKRKEPKYNGGIVS